MTASVTITLTVPAVEKHCQQMRHAAQALTDVQRSIEVSQSAENPKRLTARFSVPDARQEDVVDRFGREFWVDGGLQRFVDRIWPEEPPNRVAGRIDLLATTPPDILFASDVFWSD